MGGILDLINRNAALNSHYIQAKFSVLGLDFFAKEWSAELENKLKEVTVILAADGEFILLFERNSFCSRKLSVVIYYCTFLLVVYDVDLTEAFVQTLMKVMCVKPKKTLFFALEKR